MDGNNMENATTGGQTGAEEEKTFTQSEVDGLIEKRLARERKKLAKNNSLDIETREKELNKRELRADMRERLADADLSKDILDILDYTDEESCTESLETIKRIIDQEVKKQLAKHQSIAGGAVMKKAATSSDDAISAAFKRH